VSRGVSLLAVLVVVTASGIQALAGLLLVAALVVLSGVHAFGAFSLDQLQAIAFMFLAWNSQTYNFYLVFFGLWCMSIGYLVFRSGFIPRILGAGMALAGVGYFTYLYPPLANFLFPFNLALGIGELALLVWLLIRGVDERRWNERAAIAT
jgi:hypothetical protein